MLVLLMRSSGKLHFISIIVGMYEKAGFIRIFFSVKFRI